MIVLGLLLLIVGAALGYFFTDQFVRFAAAILVLIGLVLVVLGVVDAGDVEVKEAVVVAGRRWF